MVTGYLRVQSVHDVLHTFCVVVVSSGAHLGQDLARSLTALD
jgi:hypothetical protein